MHLFHVFLYDELALLNLIWEIYLIKLNTLRRGVIIIDRHLIHVVCEVVSWRVPTTVLVVYHKQFLVVIKQQEQIIFLSVIMRDYRTVFPGDYLTEMLLEAIKEE